MSNFQCAILSRSNTMIEYLLRVLGKTFKIDQNHFSLIPIRPNEITFDNHTSINNQLEQLSFQSYNSIIIGVKFDRIDLMNHEIKQYILPLQKYQKNIVILVVGIEQTEQYEENSNMVQTMLQRFFPIKSLVFHDIHQIQRNLSNYIQEMSQIQINLKDDDLPSNDTNFTQQLDQLFNNYLQQNNEIQNTIPHQNLIDQFLEWIKIRLQYYYIYLTRR